MNVLKNRTIIAAVCIILAGVVAFGLLPKLYQNQEATTTVYRAADAIPRGTLIEEKHIESVEVGAFNLTSRALTDPELIIGQYALTDIPKEDYLFPEKIGGFVFTEALDTVMQKGQKLVSVTLPGNAAGLSGHLESGDIVSVVVFIAAHDTFVTDEETGFDVRVNVPAQTLLCPELANITVYAIENARVESMEDVRNSGESNADAVPKTVTLIVTEEQAIMLVEAENTGRIHLVFERRGV